MNSTKFQELKLKQILTFSVPPIIATAAIILLGIFPGHNPTILVIGLIIASIWPAMKFRKIYKAGMHASTATPQILRDIAEARKAGIGPEKCVARACSRKNYNMFNEIANSIANKLEWGIPVKNIFSWMEKEIKDFQVLVSFKILFEIIAAGGGNVHTLGSLAGTSEKIYEIEKTKQDQVKPYLMIGFMLMGITGFTTLLVIDSLTSIGIQSEMEDKKIAELELQSKAKFEAFALSVIIQSWFAGLFLSKITTGTLSGGFQYSIILVIISLLGVISIGSGIMDVNTFFGDSA